MEQLQLLFQTIGKHMQSTEMVSFFLLLLQQYTHLEDGKMSIVEEHFSVFHKNKILYSVDILSGIP
jgi:hypothetical protein